jgi:hypothetical protein
MSMAQTIFSRWPYQYERLLKSLPGSGQGTLPVRLPSSEHCDASATTDIGCGAQARRPGQCLWRVSLARGAGGGTYRRIRNTCQRALRLAHRLMKRYCSGSEPRHSASELPRHALDRKSFPFRKESPSFFSVHVQPDFFLAIRNGHIPLR